MADRDVLASPHGEHPRGRRRVAVISAAAVALAAVAVGVGLAAGGPDARSALPSARPTPAAPSPTPSPQPPPEPSAPPSPRPSPPVPPQLTAATGSRLLVVQGTRLAVLDVDTGRRTAMRTVPRPQDYERLDALAVGGHLVLVGDNNTGAGTGPFPAYATTAGPGSRLRVIGMASYLMPSDRPGRVWLIAETDTNDEAGSTLSEVDLAGHVFRHARFRDSFDVRPFAGAYLRETRLADGSPGGDTELVDRVGQRLRLYPDLTPALVSGDMALLQAESSCRPCRVKVLTAGAPPTERVVSLAREPGWLEAALSPDRARIFSSVHEERPDDSQQHLLYSHLSELDLGSGRARDVSDALTATYYGPSFQFSADGRWMFFIDADAHSVDAYDLRARRCYRLPGRFDTITQLAVL